MMLAGKVAVRLGTLADGHVSKGNHLELDEAGGVLETILHLEPWTGPGSSHARTSTGMTDRAMSQPRHGGYSGYSWVPAEVDGSSAAFWRLHGMRDTAASGAGTGAGTGGSSTMSSSSHQHQQQFSSHSQSTSSTTGGSGMMGGMGTRL